MLRFSAFEPSVVSCYPRVIKRQKRKGERSVGTMVSSVVEKRALGFLDFPGEVRNMIYPHLLILPNEDRRGLAAPTSTPSSFTASSLSAPHSKRSDTVTDTDETVITSNQEPGEEDAKTLAEPRTDQSKPHHLYPAILATNRHINAEATPLLYALNTFTAIITTTSLLTPHAPDLFLSKHRYIHGTRSWTIVIDLVASTPDSWGSSEWDWRGTIDEGRNIVDVLKTRVTKVCRALEHLKGLETVRIEVVSDYGWQLRSRLAGLGMVRLLEKFKKVKAREVEFEGASALVRQKSILNVWKAMLGSVDPSRVEVFDDFWA